MARGRATDTSALVLAAARVFLERGYHNATIDHIAEAAGISRPTVYKYTRSKQQLLDLMVTEITGYLGERLREILDLDLSPMERLDEYVRAHVQASISNRSFYAIVFNEEVELSVASKKEFRKWAHDVTGDFKGLIEECLDVGPTSPGLDPAITANLVLSMLTSLHRWYDEHGTVSADALADQILRLVRPALGGAKPRRSARTRSVRV